MAQSKKAKKLELVGMTKRKTKRPQCKRRTSGKHKGGAYERKICKRLSLWVTNNKHEDCFWRSAMSGGRATVGAKTGAMHRRQAGDISSTSTEGCVLTDKAFLELKHYKDLNLLAFIIFNRGKLAGFWRRAVKEAKKYGKTPMLICKQNYVEDFVIVHQSKLPNVPRLCRFRGLAMLSFDAMLKQPFDSGDFQ